MCYNRQPEGRSRPGDVGEKNQNFDHRKDRSQMVQSGKDDESDSFDWNHHHPALERCRHKKTHNEDPIKDANIELDDKIADEFEALIIKNQEDLEKRIKKRSDALLLDKRIRIGAHTTPEDWKNYLLQKVYRALTPENKKLYEVRHLTEATFLP